MEEMTRSAAPEVRAASTWRRWAWILFAAFVVHNVEEAATMQSFLAHADDAFRSLPMVGSLSLPAFLAALTTITLVGLALVAVGTTVGTARWKPYLPGTLAAVIVLNVAIPHVPAAVLTGGYTPGLVTALALNLPVSVAFLRRVHEEGALTGRGVLTCFVAGLVLLLLVLPLALLASQKLVVAVA